MKYCLVYSILVSLNISKKYDDFCQYVLIIKRIFDQSRSLFCQTGASKALSLLNPELSVMWDTAIRKRLKREWIPGIMNGESGEHYIIFLKGIQTIIEQSRIAEKLPPNSVVAKK